MHKKICGYTDRALCDSYDFSTTSEESDAPNNEIDDNVNEEDFSVGKSMELPEFPLQKKTSKRKLSTPLTPLHTTNKYKRVETSPSDKVANDIDISSHSTTEPHSPKSSSMFSTPDNKQCSSSVSDDKTQKNKQSMLRQKKDICNTSLGSAIKARKDSQPTYPMTEAKFQKTVLKMLADLSKRMENIEAANSQLQNLDGLRDVFHIEFVKDLDEFDEFEEELADQEKFDSFVKQLSMIGGSKLQNTTKRVLEKFLPDTTQALFNMKGNGEKRKFEGTKSFIAVTRAVLLTHKNETESSVAVEIKNLLKHAPKRAKNKEDKEN